MKTKAYTTILAVVTLVLFSGISSLAQKEHHHTTKKPTQTKMSKMAKTGMTDDPHHVLAMAYMQNTTTFAKALNNQAQSSSQLDAAFAHTAVGEIRRSLDQMEEHRGEHMKMMSEGMRADMAPMMTDMEIHRNMIIESVTALETDLQAERPDAKQVAVDSANLVTHLDEMAKMHNETEKAKMKM